MSIRRSLPAAFLLLVVLHPAFCLDQRSFAIKLFNEGMFEQAAAVLEEALDQGKALPFDLALLGLSYLRLGRLPEAENMLERARSLDPFLAIVHLGLGNLRFEQQRFQEAYEAFNRAAEIEPHSQEAKNGMVASLINQGAEQFSAGGEKVAEEYFQQALAIDPYSVPALRNLGILELERGHPAGAASYLEKARSLAPQDAQILSLLVKAREEEGDATALMRELQRLVALQPRNSSAWAKLGLLYEQHGDDGQAEQAFDQAEQWGTDEPYPYYWLAKRRRSIALAHLAVGKAIQQAGLFRLQAAQTVEKKQGELGEDELHLLKELSTRIAEPLTVLTDSLELLEELHGDPSAFRQDLMLLVDWYPHSLELKEAMAELSQRQGEWSEALSTWETVLKSHPTSIKAQAGRAKALEMLGQPDRAALAYRRALELDPRDEELYEGLFRVYRALGEERELLSLLEEQSLRDTRNPVLFGRLAALEESLGMTEEAQAHRKRKAELELVESGTD